MLCNHKTAQPGFNFIEMLISIVIMALFIGVVGPKFMSLLGRGKRTATASILKTVSAAITQYKIDVGQLPNTLDDLVRKPEGANGWNGPYAGSENEANPTVQQDAWNQPLVYKRNERGVVPPFELYSMGDPDKEEDRIYAK